MMWMLNYQRLVLAGVYRDTSYLPLVPSINNVDRTCKFYRFYAFFRGSTCSSVVVSRPFVHIYSVLPNHEQYIKNKSVVQNFQSTVSFN